MDLNHSDLGEREDVQNGAAEAPVTDSAKPSVSAEVPAESSAETVVAAAEEMQDAPAVSEEAQAAPSAAVEEAQDWSVATGEVPAASEEEGEAAPAADIPESVGKISRGQLIEGVISRTSPMEVFVDLGDGIEGVIPGRELDRMSRPMVEGLKVGTSVTVYVVNPQHLSGHVLLSVNRAIEEMDWKEAEGYQKSQKVYEGHIAGYNKGGLIVRFGRLRGFVPQSQISDDRRGLLSGDTPQERWENMVNNAIMVKVVEVDRSRNRLILSERAAAREAREKRKESLVGELAVGDVRTGRVVSLEDFGAFVDIGGAEGLVHLTELSWKHVTHPREVLKVNQPVKVEVISVDKKRNRIGLSIKRQEADPWDEVATTYAIGQLVQGTVTKLTKFGAFARLVDAPDIEGLIHISELSDERVNHPKEVVQEGDKLTLRVVKIDVKNRRLGLSLKRVNSAEYLDMDWFKSPKKDE
ncbi:MAG: S1 RNA-binding domain-containing protein [Anaerolineae bacterium]